MCGLFMLLDQQNWTILDPVQGQSYVCRSLSKSRSRTTNVKNYTFPGRLDNHYFGHTQDYTFRHEDIRL